MGKDTAEVTEAPAAETSEVKANEPDAAFKSSAYGKALTALKAAHKTEFETIISGLYAQHGYEYQPRLTPEERKRAELNRLAQELGVQVVG